ncbi:MAG: MazG-like family protein [Pasteurellaceae bacterium]|nr:MazG-like family protein [Pasteurellaceae bacterium]
MKDLIQQIEQWAEDRNIFNGSTVQKQIFKLAEEIGELFSGHNKNDLDKIRDSVGDCVVILTNLRKMLNIEETLYDTHCESEYIYDIPPAQFNADESLAWILSQQGTLSDYCLADPTQEPNPEMVNLIFYNLMRYCRAKELNIVGCTYFAYNQIKHRKGKMIDGVFVKEEDLNEQPTLA